MSAVRARAVETVYAPRSVRTKAARAQHNSPRNTVHFAFQRTVPCQVGHRHASVSSDHDSVFSGDGVGYRSLPPIGIDHDGVLRNP